MFDHNFKFAAYYVIGGGVRAAIMMDNVAAVNGIVHYIDRVLGVPYKTLYEIMRNDSRLQWVQSETDFISNQFNKVSSFPHIWTFTHWNFCSFIKASEFLRNDFHTINFQTQFGMKPIKIPKVQEPHTTLNANSELSPNFISCCVWPKLQTCYHSHHSLGKCPWLSLGLLIRK